MMIDEDLLLCNYDYNLPKELIAYEPLKDQTRLLVYERTHNTITHASFKDLPYFLPPCAIVFNDTKVIKARIYGHKENGAKVELLFHRALNDFEFKVQIKGRVQKNQELFFEKGLKAVILELFDDGFKKVQFFKEELLNHTKLLLLLEDIGHIPLPPYIKRAAVFQDSLDYQSVFAKNLGSIAAPTASLHFSKAMLESLALKHKLYYLTLHIGAGTFKKIECENIKEHNMHSETYCINDETASLILSNEALLGVGTTTTRCIEYFFRTQKKSGENNLFLHPKEKILRQNYLLSNFHLPKSSLIMLIACFIGRKKTLELYEEAIKEKYRFYSYGDAMLII